MMVELGLADGMVSGAVHTTAHTIRPGARGREDRARRLGRVLGVLHVPAQPGAGLRRLRGQPRPHRRAARRHRHLLGRARRPRSGSSRGSRCCPTPPAPPAPAPTCEKVTEATALVRERAPDLLVEGPIQYDAAIDAAVARTKLPDSAVAGRATVFVFPDLNTGNNTYKAVQRSAGAVAVGPVLQGLRKPVNDLSRGATVRDIVNTVAITAIQAQAAWRMATLDARLARAGGQRRLVVAEVQPGRRRHRGRRSGRGVERIGEETGSLTHEVGGTEHRDERSRSRRSRRRSPQRPTPSTTHGPRSTRSTLAAVGHRVVHGGPLFSAPALVDDDVLAAVEDLVPLAPLHNPANLEGLRVRPAAVPRRPAGRGVRHRLPPDDAAGRLHLRGAARVARGAPDPPLRLPRHVARLRLADAARAPRRARSTTPTSSCCTSATAPPPPPCAAAVGRHLDGADAAWRAW